MAVFLKLCMVHILVFMFLEETPGVIKFFFLIGIFLMYFLVLHTQKPHRMAEPCTNEDVVCQSKKKNVMDWTLKKAQEGIS